MEHAHRLNEILSSFAHPGGVFILTGYCEAQNLIERDLNLFSYVFIAIIILKTNDTSVDAVEEFGQFENLEIASTLQQDRGRIESKPFFIIDLPQDLAISVVDHIIEENRNYTGMISMHSGSIDRWQPTVLIIWEEESNETEFEHEIESADFLELFSNFNLQLNSNIFIIIFEPIIESNETMASQEDQAISILYVWEVYQVKQRKIYSQVESLCVRDNSKEPEFRKGIALENHAERRRNFFGEKLIGVVKNSSSSTTSDWGNVQKREDGSLYISDGYVASLYWNLQTMMNFTDEIILGDSPVINHSGELVGKTVNLLRSGEGDFYLSYLTFNTQRAKSLTFLTPTHDSLVYVFFKQPSPHSLRNFVVAPLKVELWLTLIAFWVILSILLEGRLVLLSNHFRTINSLTGIVETKSILEKDFPFLKECWIWCVASVCQKSFYLNPRSASLKMTFIFGSLISIISYTAYSASFLSSLAVSNIPVKSFFDLSTSNFVFTVHQQSQPLQNFLQALIHTYNLRQRITVVSTEKEVPHLFRVSIPKWHDSIGDDHVHSTKKAFVSYAALFYQVAEYFNYTNSFVCNHISFFKLPIGSYLSKSAMLVKKGSEFKEVLNYLLAHLRDIGLVHRSDEIYNRDNVLRCPVYIETKNQPADFSDIFTILLGLLIGFCVSILFIAGELILYRGTPHLPVAFP